MTGQPAGFTGGTVADAAWPRHGREDRGGKPARVLWQSLAWDGDGCFQVCSARASCLTFCMAGWAGSGVARYLGWLATGQLWTGSPVSAYWR